MEKAMIHQVRARLAAYAPRQLANGGWPRAGVLVPLFEQHGRLHVVLTKRTEHVQSHKGEVSFPGGTMEAGDTDLSVTALRESEEEIGLRPQHVRIIGRLDEIVTISNFHVSAFVGEIEASALPYAWRPHAAEVARVLEVPIDHLLDAANLVEVPRQRDGELVLVEGVRFDGEIIFGATWRVLRNFLHVAVGRAPGTGAGLSSAWR